MTVLQTVALGHLAIPPVGLLREQYTRCGRRCQGEIKEILIFYDARLSGGLHRQPGLVNRFGLTASACML